MNIKGYIKGLKKFLPISEEEIIEKEYQNLTTLNDVVLLKKRKYLYTFIAKKNRDYLIMINAITLIITILVSFLTLAYTFNKSIYDSGGNIIKRIHNVQIDNMKIDIDKMNDEEKLNLKSDIIKLIESEKDLSIEGIGATVKSVKYFFIAMVIMSIAIYVIYQLIIIKVSKKASEYEAKVIMIDERIKEINEVSWEKAQKVQIKMENGITIKDNVTIRY